MGKVILRYETNDMGEGTNYRLMSHVETLEAIVGRRGGK